MHFDAIHSPKSANLLKFYLRAQNVYMQHFMAFSWNPDSVHVAKTIIKTQKNLWRQYMPPLPLIKSAYGLE